jgi:regulation of enolase protein 1 (concanavalin A-like superfamily)
MEARTDSDWEQLRIAHLSAMGETTAAMGATSTAELINSNSVGVGIYACSPGDSRFEAKFRHLAFQAATWEMHDH